MLMSNNSIVDHNKIQRRLYVVNIDLIDNGILESIPNISIINFSIEYNYRDNFFPIIKLDLTINNYLYNLILNNKNTIKFRIKLFSYRKEQKQDGTDLEIDKKLIINDIFQPIIPILDSENNKKELNTEKDDDSPSRALDVYLFNLNAFNINKNIINFIAQDCKIKDVVGYILKSFNIKNVLMSSPQNNTKYEQVIVPPLNLKNSIQYIADTYGIYTNGIKQFYDFDYLYILRNDFTEIPTMASEYSNVYINVTKLMNDNESLNIGSYKDNENNCYVINTNNVIEITKNGINNKELNGNKLRIYDRNTLENSLIFDTNSKKFKINKSYNETNINYDSYNGNDKITYLFNNSENNTLINNYEKLNQYSNIEFSMYFLTLDLEIFKPNRRYIFNFEELEFAKKYNGVYMLEYLVTAMDQTNGEIQASAKFKKI